MTSPVTSDLAITTHGLSRRYGDVLALDALDLRVRTGEVYALLGRNGAGKTTTIRLLLGMIRPTAGHAEVLGERVVRGGTSPWGRVGHLVETATAYPDLTTRENLDVARRLYGVQSSSSVEAAIERLALGEYVDRPARTLSQGNLQRLALARALLHEPDLVVLDEPSVGLDPAGVAEVRALLRSLSRQRGVTVFLSSHILTEVARLADRIGIVHRGRLVQQLDAAELDALRDPRLEVAARDADGAESALRAAGYAPTRSADGASPGPATLELRDPRALERPEEVARVLVHAGTPPVRLAVVRDDLETHFLRWTGP